MCIRDSFLPVEGRQSSLGGLGLLLRKGPACIESQQGGIGFFALGHITASGLAKRGSVRHHIKNIICLLYTSTAGVDVRERFALANHCDEEHWALPCTGAVSESIILSTCNRVEILAAGTGDMAEQIPVSYTHLDVYKRQRKDRREALK